LKDVVDSSNDRSGNSSRELSTSSEEAEEGSGSGGSEEARERVINIKNCPLCHRPRLSSKAEVDIVTHIALCASQDWGRMDKIVVGNFVTAARRRESGIRRLSGSCPPEITGLGAVEFRSFHGGWVAHQRFAQNSANIIATEPE